MWATGTGWPVTGCDGMGVLKEALTHGQVVVPNEVRAPRAKARR